MWLVAGEEAEGPGVGQAQVGGLGGIHHYGGALRPLHLPARGGGVWWMVRAILREKRKGGIEGGYKGLKGEKGRYERGLKR